MAEVMISALMNFSLALICIFILLSGIHYILKYHMQILMGIILTCTIFNISEMTKDDVRELLSDFKIKKEIMNENIYTRIDEEKHA